MRVAVYSGSFNPLHTGHLAIMEHLTRKGSFDMIYLVVTPQNPLKSPGDNAQGRFEAAKQAVGRHPGLKVRVDDIELNMEPPQYTVRTLKALKAREPENDFTLVIGADNLERFPHWRDHGTILREFGVVVFPRKGYHRGHLRDRLLKEDPSYKIELLKAPLVNISSTEIREGLAAGKDMSKWLM